MDESVGEELVVPQLELEMEAQRQPGDEWPDEGRVGEQPDRAQGGTPSVLGVAG